MPLSRLTELCQSIVKHNIIVQFSLPSSMIFSNFDQRVYYFCCIDACIDILWNLKTYRRYPFHLNF